MSNEIDKPDLGFHCASCGMYHDHLPMDFGAETPAAYDSIPKSERDARCELTPDFCVIDENEFFIRGCLEIPVLDSPRPFVWGVWTSISFKSFHRMGEIWESLGESRSLRFLDGFVRSCRFTQILFC
ncbi:hypothetical protein Q31b_16910 [Novipirellula aureliae]|uniref:DUF2199 domain-containing protein n=1 Tax=Novipirellula aureliae TaxID=2527966 RepID=A0A5C6E6B3_9BACT|nr:DUF2199 domain-containing protein [Novipirellula aureliae]TWU44155.1 hypothetical protein Q31b_16910 [Novipirellula aureliae]